MYAPILKGVHTVRTKWPVPTADGWPHLWSCICGAIHLVVEKGHYGNILSFQMGCDDDARKSLPVQHHLIKGQTKYLLFSVLIIQSFNFLPWLYFCCCLRSINIFKTQTLKTKQKHIQLELSDGNTRAQVKAFSKLTSKESSIGSSWSRSAPGRSKMWLL